MPRRLLLCLGVCLVAGPAMAADPAHDITKGLFVTKPEACALIATKGAKVLEGDGELLVMNDIGILGNEFSCQFYDIKQSRIGTPGHLVEAYCEEPGLIFPDVFAISPYTANSVQLSGLSNIGIANTDPAGGGALEFHYCADVSRNAFK